MNAAANAKDCKKRGKKSSENGPKIAQILFFLSKLNEDLLREFPMTRKATAKRSFCIINSHFKEGTEEDK